MSQDVTHDQRDAHPVAAHTATLTRIGERMDQHDADMDAFQERLQKSVDDWHTHRVDFARLQDSVSGITSTLGRIEGTLGKIEAHAAATNGRIGKLETATAVHAWAIRLAAAALLPLWGIALKQLFGG